MNIEQNYIRFFIVPLTFCIIVIAMTLLVKQVQENMERESYHRPQPDTVVCITVAHEV